MNSKVEKSEFGQSTLISKNLPRIVSVGFTVILACTIILGYVSIERMKQISNSISHIVEVNNEKTTLAFAMRDAIRQRSVNMHAMLSTDDFFERDRLLQEFYAYAGLYRRARERLFTLGLNSAEKEIQERLTMQVNINQPLLRKVAELLMEDESPDKINSTMRTGLLEMQKLLGMLNELVDLQQAYDKDAAQQAKMEHERSVWLLIIIVSITVIIGIMIARAVANYVKLKSAEQDIAYQKVEDATKAKSNFLANMSHEIRTPLTAIIGFGETLLNSDQTIEERVDAVKTIISSSKHLLHIINDILDESKIEAGKLDIEIREFSPYKILQEVNNIIGNNARRKGLEFNINYLFPLPKTIFSDEVRLKQILLNLSSNAVKFTDTGHIFINVRSNMNTNEIVFSVVDTGIGLTENSQKKIFDSFSQADASTTRKYGGSGLGLTLSKRLAVLLDGDITVTSEPDHGSDFSVTISTGKINRDNLIYSDNELPTTLTNGQNQKVLAQLSGKVLLAEDNLDNQRLLSLFLTKMGVDVTIADNGQEAVYKALEGQFDLVYMDMQMPIMGGIEATQILIERDYQTPIIALTANASAEDKAKCLNAGCVDFLTKPIQRDQLYHTTSQYIQHSEQQNAKAIITSELLESDPSIANILQKFIDSLPNVKSEIETAIEKKNWEEVKSLIHQVKGTGGNFGYPIITNTAAKIEFQLINEDYLEVEILSKSLFDILDSIIAGFETYKTANDESYSNAEEKLG